MEYCPLSGWEPEPQLRNPLTHSVCLEGKCNEHIDLSPVSAYLKYPPSSSTEVVPLRVSGQVTKSLTPPHIFPV